MGQSPTQATIHHSDTQIVGWIVLATGPALPWLAASLLLLCYWLCYWQGAASAAVTKLLKGNIVPDVAEPEVSGRRPELLHQAAAAVAPTRLQRP